jgi:hypothetical protein
MPYINEIVNIINTTLAEGKLKSSRFNKQLFGLSELLPRNYQDNQDAIPAMVSLNNSAQFSGFDDRFNIVIYHRCLSTNIVESPIQFGDGLNTAREESEMRMIVFADRNAIQLQPQQLSFLLTSATQQQLKYSQISSYAGLYGCTIEANTTNYDGVSIYQNEYKKPAQEYPVQPFQIYMAHDYKITTDYDVSCISDCLTC